MSSASCGHLARFPRDIRLCSGQSGWHDRAMAEEGTLDGLDGVAELALMIGVSEAGLREVLGGELDPGVPGPGFGRQVTIFTGVGNPRTPGRPLVAIRVEHEDPFFEVGHAVGVPLPNGRHQWSLGDPRTTLPYGEEATRDAFDLLEEYVDAAAVQQALLSALHEAINKVADVAMLRGTSW